jgi:putative acetyltransferase
MKHILNIGEQQKIQRLYSEVSITARPFFEYFGFRVVNTKEIAVRGQKLNNFLMKRVVRGSVK